MGALRLVPRKAHCEQERSVRTLFKHLDHQVDIWCHENVGADTQVEARAQCCSNTRLFASRSLTASDAEASLEEPGARHQSYQRIPLYKSRACRSQARQDSAARATHPVETLDDALSKIL